MCVPKMAQQDFPYCKFPTMVWRGGGGGSGGGGFPPSSDGVWVFKCFPGEPPLPPLQAHPWGQGLRLQQGPRASMVQLRRMARGINGVGVTNPFVHCPHKGVHVKGGGGGGDIAAGRLQIEGQKNKTRAIQ